MFSPAVWSALNCLEDPWGHAVTKWAWCRPSCYSCFSTLAAESLRVCCIYYSNKSLTIRTSTYSIIHVPLVSNSTDSPIAETMVSRVQIDILCICPRLPVVVLCCPLLSLTFDEEISALPISFQAQQRYCDARRSHPLIPSSLFRYAF